MPKHDAYRQLVDHAPDAILVISDGRILFANPAAATLVGLAIPSLMIGRSVFDFTPAASRAEIAELIRQLHTTRQSVSLRATPIVRADGTVRVVELMTCPTSWEGQKASIVFVRDVSERAKAERELRASEERYRQVVESMNEALVVYDANANISFVNQQFCGLFDCRPEEVIGRSAEQVYAPETASLALSGIARRQKGLHDRYEALLKSRSGKTVHAHVSAAPLVHDGTFTGSLALITDVTDHQQTREKLRASETRFRELVDKSPNFIYSFDTNNCYTAVNKAVADFLGMTEESILGRTLEEVGFPPDVVREWNAQMDRARATGETQVLERVVSRNGQPPRIMRRILSPMYDDAGAVAGVTGIAMDVTEERTNAQRADKLLRAVEQMDEVMFTTDANGVITYVNPAFENVYGFTREEALGQTPRILKSFEMPGESYERFWRELKAGLTVRMEFINRRKDGTRLRMLATVSPLHDVDGRLTGYTAVQRDVTAERRAQEERRQFEDQFARAAKMQALGTLAGGIAHDFNNILSIVLTHATLASLSASKPERLTSALDTIKRAVQRGAGLSRQILTFARETTTDFKSVDPVRVLREIGSMISEMFPRNIRIEVVQEGTVPLITADADQLHQAVLNLCLNARDAMAEGGTLTLSVGRVERDAVRQSFPTVTDRDHVCVSIADSGDGMSKETAARIFEPFFTTKQVGKGSGLGLAVVYGIMKAHEGWIDVDSEPGRGTTMRLYFPAKAEDATDAPVQASDAVDGGHESILLIEDEVEIAQAVAAQLSAAGYSVQVANDPNSASAMIGAGAFDVIITDLGLPGMTSRDLVAHLRRVAPKLPMIPMTGYVDPELHADVVAAGTQPILQKPFSIDELLRRIREAVR